MEIRRFEQEGLRVCRTEPGTRVFARARHGGSQAGEADVDSYGDQAGVGQSRRQARLTKGKADESIERSS